MNFLHNMYSSLTSVCRKEKSLNGKRAYPFDEKEKTIKKSSKTNSRENSISNKTFERIQEEHNNMQMSIFADEFPANQSAFNEEIIIDYQNTGLENNHIVINSDSMEAVIEHNNNNEDKFEVSTEDLSQIGEKKLSSASEDSDNEDEELEEKKPYKKIKLNSVQIMEAEEKTITEGWNYNFKSLRKYLGRMNRLFEITQGYKEKRDPLVISPEKQEAEPMLIEQEAIEIEQQTLPVEQGTLQIEQEDNFDQENVPSFGNQNLDLIESFNPNQMKNEKASSKKKVVVNPSNQMRRLSSQDFTVAMPVFQATLEV